MFRSPFLVTTAVLCFSYFGHAEEPVAPRAAAVCVACHGAKGVSANPLWPNLAGQKHDYLVKQLTEFKEGRRQDPLMGPIAKTLSEADIQSLAQYFSSL